MKATVIHHSADFDGLFCREIARKFLPNADLIGWDFRDKPLDVPAGGGLIYVMDLPLDKPFGFDWHGPDTSKSRTDAMTLGLSDIVWIDHHKSAIESHPKDIPGYRIDGVAACRLAWQWFSWVEEDRQPENMPDKQRFIDRKIEEPWAVQLAGEYDIWDKRDPDAELFQHGLRSEELFSFTWDDLLSLGRGSTVVRLLNQGRALQYAKTKENESIILHGGFTVQFEGLTFLACNHARYNSHLFTAGLKPEHDACFGFKYSKGEWEVSLYHAPGKEHHDLSQIAIKYGGGGHRGACGFRATSLPFLNP